MAAIIAGASAPVARHGLATAYHDVRTTEHGGVLEFGCRPYNSISVCSTAAPRPRSAAFVFPIGLLQASNVDTPYHSILSGFNGSGRINQVAQDTIPSRMVVVRLQCPRADTGLYLQRIIRRWRVWRATSLQVRKSLLGQISVARLFIHSESGKRSGCEDANQRAEDVRLFEINVSELLDFVFYRCHHSIDVGSGQASRQRNTIVEPLPTFRVVNQPETPSALVQPVAPSGNTLWTTRRLSHAIPLPGLPR